MPYTYICLNNYYYDTKDGNMDIFKLIDDVYKNNFLTFNLYIDGLKAEKKFIEDDLPNLFPKYDRIILSSNFDIAGNQFCQYLYAFDLSNFKSYLIQKII
jgi:hypothetical protein